MRTTLQAPITSAKPSEFSQYLLSAGAHPQNDLGWIVEYQFGKVKVSVYWTPTTNGIEMSSSASKETHDYLTGEEIRSLLVGLKNKYAKRRTNEGKI